MHEIKCPKCGEVFTVDESGYAAIVGQVRDEEFHRELAQREKTLHWYAPKRPEPSKRRKPNCSSRLLN